MGKKNQEKEDSSSEKDLERARKPERKEAWGLARAHCAVAATSSGSTSYLSPVSMPPPSPVHP